MFIRRVLGMLLRCFNESPNALLIEDYWSILKYLEVLGLVYSWICLAGSNEGSNWGCKHSRSPVHLPAQYSWRWCSPLLFKTCFASINNSKIVGLQTTSIKSPKSCLGPASMRKPKNVKTQRWNPYWVSPPTPSKNMENRGCLVTASQSVGAPGQWKLETHVPSRTKAHPRTHCFLASYPSFFLLDYKL